MTAPLPRDTQHHCDRCGFTTPLTTPGMAAQSLERHSCTRFRELQARAERRQNPPFDLIDWLRARVEVMPSGCWRWMGALRPDGYGYSSMRGQRGLMHRLVWIELVGPIPNGKQLDHLCRNRACCNPDHLEVVTQRVNILRGMSLPARHARKNICIRGHELVGDNVLIESDGGRRCRPCRRIREAARRRPAVAA